MSVIGSPPKGVKPSISINPAALQRFGIPPMRIFTMTGDAGSVFPITKGFARDQITMAKP